MKTVKPKNHGNGRWPVPDAETLHGEIQEQIYDTGQWCYRVVEQSMVCRQCTIFLIPAPSGGVRLIVFLFFFDFLICVYEFLIFFHDFPVVFL